MYLGQRSFVPDGKELVSYGHDGREYWELSISTDFYKYLKKSFNRILSNMAWNVVCELLKYLCGTTKLHKKENWVI